MPPCCIVHRSFLLFLSCCLTTLLAYPLWAEPPTWDKYFERAVSRAEAATRADLASVNKENWEEKKTQWRGELLEMLGLNPLPERTDLQTTITGSIHRDGVTIERLHYQSRPGLYVPANLYLPAGEAPEKGWPAVLYVCGHAVVTDAGRKLGNKTAYQHHGLWFARHGVACLIIDTVQLGELHGEHHGTYRLGRWDWISRGYTPAGVEAWNAVRGIDLLESWPGIDGSRIGITGRSGGGAYSWFAAAIDERIQVAVPVAGITDLRNHVIDGCVGGHCDCMYMVNYFGWDYPKVAALIAPRPLLLSNSDSDKIFPMDGVVRTHRELAKLYAKLGKSGNYGVLITPGPHKDTQELQVGAFRWILRTLQGEAPIVSDAALKELEPQELAVFEREAPADERVAAVGSWFVDAAESVSDPQRAADLFRQQWFPALRHTALALPLGALSQSPEFSVTPLQLKSAGSPGDERPMHVHHATLADGLTLSVLHIGPREGHPDTAQASTSATGKSATGKSATDEPAIEAQGVTTAVVHLGRLDDMSVSPQAWLDFAVQPATVELLAQRPQANHYFIHTRGSNWQQADLTVKDQTQIIRRFYLLGQSPEAHQLSDVLASLQLVTRLEAGASQSDAAVILTGVGRSAAIATLAGLLCEAEVAADLPRVAELRIVDYPTDPLLAPMLPGLLRVCDYASLLAAAQGSFSVVMEGRADSEERASRLLVDSSTEPQQANGLKIVEVAQHSARIWVRATRWTLPNLGDLPAVEFPTQAEQTQPDGNIRLSGKTHADGHAQPSGSLDRSVTAPPNHRTQMRPILPETGVKGLQYAVPGVSAEVRVGYRSGSADWNYSEWVPVEADSDYSALIDIAQLQPGKAYALRTQTRALGSTVISSTLAGEFKTLPADDSTDDFRLAIGTCQDFPDRDGPHGFDLYRSMSKRNTDAFIMAGDVVYYDRLARSVPLANYHWQRTYSLPTLVDFHRHTPTYFLKDDHDTYVDDSWPGQRHAWTEDFTFEEGQRIFKQQTGLPTPAYRTFLIGRDLQVWLMEGRDFRSPNNAADGPGKTIWGAEQMQWLERTLEASPAKFKIVVSPTPLVGPDRDKKRDNHSNASFQAEGNQVRQLLASHPNTVSVCGDRHWQYHSVDPASGLHEFSVGPASDRHAGGWKPSDYREGTHQFLRVAGGYLEVELSGQPAARTLVLRHLDTQGNEQHSHTMR